jgi:magnesium transporter
MATRLIKTRQKSKGLPPGSIIPHSAETKVDVEVISYSADVIKRQNITSIKDCLKEIDDEKTVTWINIKGLTDSKVILSIGETFGIHTLWLEDVLNIDHRPKLEELDDIIFSIVKAVDYGVRKPKYITFEQISLFLGTNFVISFQEFPGDVFEPVIDRLIKKKGKIRESQADYLFYALIDTIVDNYYFILEKLGSEIESIDQNITDSYTGEIYKEISRLRNELIYLRKSANPIKEVLSQCLKTQKPEINKKNKKYFKDAYDHIVQVVEIVDSYFQMLDGARDSFNSMQANKMNEIMKVLTIFSSIFIPLTFVAGIYGMNFDSIPELKWQWGYLYVWILMISIGISLGLFFRIKKWI